jgi:hypothetical protein
MLIFIIAPNKKYIIVLHPFIELGVTHLMPDSCVGVLCEKNEIATPLENCAASITSVNIDVPKWEPLYLAVDTMENVKVNRHCSCSLIDSSRSN